MIPFAAGVVVGVFFAGAALGLAQAMSRLAQHDEEDW